MSDIDLSPPLPPLVELLDGPCDACGGSRVLMHSCEGLIPAGPWSGEVLPGLRGGTIVKPGEAVECVCVEPKDIPGHPAAASLTTAEVEAFR